jgi:hypothetical protein
MTESQTQTTRFCARVIGLVMLIIGVIVVARFNDLVLMMPAILQDSALSFIAGIFTLILGVILFAAHHHWNSPVAIVITIIAILTVLRGLLLMLAPDLLAGVAAQFLNAGYAAWIAGAIAILLGLWLTFVGWFAKSL